MHLKQKVYPKNSPSQEEDPTPKQQTVSAIRGGLQSPRMSKSKAPTEARLTEHFSLDECSPPLPPLDESPARLLIDLSPQSVHQNLQLSPREHPKVGSFGDIENRLEYSQSSISSAKIKPIEFYVIAPEDGEGNNLMYSMSEMLKRPNLDWKSCKVASEDLRVIQQLGSCRECSEGRPLAIFMPCGHGGSCLRCSIQKSNKQKMCHYCAKVNSSLLAN